MDNSGLVGVRHVMGTPRVGEEEHLTCLPRVVSWRKTFAELEATTCVGETGESFALRGATLRVTRVPIRRGGIGEF